MAKLSGKTALVTGATSGIGAATVRLFASLGAKVAVGGLELADAERVAASIREGGGEAIGVAADVSDEAQVAAMIQKTVDSFGRLDVLHNNAAITDTAFQARDLDVASMDIEIWDKTLDVDLRGAVLCSKHAIPHMLKAGGGSIIMTSSGKGLQGDLMGTAYGAAKAGLVALARYIAAQYGKQGVRCNAIVVGLVMTESLEANMPKAFQDLVEAHHLTPYLGRPEHIAQVAAFLASDESAFVTGSAIAADGGFTSHTPVLADMVRMMQSGGATHK